MNAFEIPLLPGIKTPVIELYGSTCLIDTGALIPVLSEPLENLKSFNPKELNYENVKIHGIGGEEHGKVVSLYNFQIGTMTFQRCDFFVPDEHKLSYSFLLPASMFYGTDYYIKTTKRKFVVEVPTIIPAIRNFILDYENEHLSAKIDNVLIQENDLNCIPYMVFQNNPYRETSYNRNNLKEINLDGLHNAFERFEEDGAHGVCGYWEVERDLSSSSSLWKLSFSGTPIAICESKPKHDYIKLLDKNLLDKTFSDICEIAQSVFPECQMNPTEKKKIRKKNQMLLLYYWRL